MKDSENIRKTYEWRSVNLCVFLSACGGGGYHKRAAMATRASKIKCLTFDFDYDIMIDDS
jgi:hypothetical protein